MIPQLEAPLPGDALWMARALEQARAAAVEGEVPVGAVITRGGRLVAEGRNRTLAWSDPTAHAEVVSLREAARRVGAARLTDCTVYVTLEPCAMCAGAMVHARVARLVYGAADPKTGMCGSLDCLVQDARLNHRVRLTAGVLGESAGGMLRSFFRSRR